MRKTWRMEAVGQLVPVVLLISAALAGCAQAGGPEQAASSVPAAPDASPVPAAPQASPVPAAPGSLRVTLIGAMLVERATHQATVLESGEVLITGGCTRHGCEEFQASAEVFCPDTQTFESVAPMTTRRGGHIAVALRDGRVLVSGGWTGEEATASAEIYDPAAGAWTAIEDMTEARSSHTAVRLDDGRVLLVGGGSGGLPDLVTAEVFDPATSTFSAVGPMQENHYLATGMADGRVLVTGGQNAAGEISNRAEVFDPATGEFQPTGEMAQPRVKHAAALLADGRVLVIAGSDERSAAGRYTGTEVYDPATGAFSPGPDLQWARHKIRDAVVVLPSGAVLVAGGAVRLELFDPAGEVLIPVDGELSGPREFATATLLPGGEVLVLGGYDDQTRPSDAAWLVHAGP